MKSKFGTVTVRIEQGKIKHENAWFTISENNMLYIYDDLTQLCAVYREWQDVLLTEKSGKKNE